MGLVGTAVVGFWIVVFTAGQAQAAPFSFLSLSGSMGVGEQPGHMLSGIPRHPSLNAALKGKRPQFSKKIEIGSVFFIEDIEKRHIGRYCHSESAGIQSGAISVVKKEEERCVFARYRNVRGNVESGAVLSEVGRSAHLTFASSVEVSAANVVANISRWRISGIPHLELEARSEHLGGRLQIVNLYRHIGDREISADFRLPQTSRLQKCQPDINNAADTHDDCAHRGPKHPLGPKRHSLLGVQVTLFAFFVGGSIGCVFLGLKIADRSLDADKLARNPLYELGVIAGAIIGAGGGIGLLGLGHWLAFDSDWLLLRNGLGL